MYLHKVRLAKAPVAGEMTLLRCDGTRAYVFGWVSLTVTADGSEEFQSICIDITERQRKRRSREIKKYLKTISDVYDRIFAFDLSLGKMCIRDRNEVAAECDGVITEILAENGQLVEYGTELFRVRQDGGRSAEA